MSEGYRARGPGSLSAMPAAVPTATMPTATMKPTAVLPAAMEPAAGSYATTKTAAVEESKRGIGENGTRISIVVRERSAAIARNVVVSVRTLIVGLRRCALAYCRSGDDKSETAEKENGSRKKFDLSHRGLLEHRSAERLGMITRPAWSGPGAAAYRARAGDRRCWSCAKTLSAAFFCWSDMLW